MVEDVETADGHVRVDVDDLDLADSTPSNDVDAATILSSPPSPEKPISSCIWRQKKLIMALVAVIALSIVATRYASGGNSAAIGTTDVDDVGVATYNVSEGTPNKEDTSVAKTKFTATESTNITTFAGNITDFIVANSENIIRQSSTFGTNDCPDGEGLWNLLLVTDNYGFETKWQLYDSNNNVLASGPPSGTNYNDQTRYTGNLCLPSGQYFMRWFDKQGDGICCEYGEGEWTVKINGGVVLENGPGDSSFTQRDFPFVITSQSANDINALSNDGTCASDAIFLTSVLVDKDSACSYENRQTVKVSAPVPTVNVEKKLSGGTSAYDGNNAIVVSYNTDGVAGAVWVLSKRASGWVQTGRFQSANEDQLGWGVAIKGKTAVVGAPGHKGKYMPTPYGGYWAGRGKAIVLNQNENGIWVREAVLMPNVADDNSAFGSTMDIAQNIIAVGAWHDRDSRGSVFIFAKNSNGGWTEIQKLQPTDSRRSQSEYLHGNYGYTVAINDEYLAVKAPYDSYNGSFEYNDPNRGIVYVYKRRSDGQFQQVARLCTPEGRQVGEVLQDTIFLDDFLLVGAPGKNKVYVFKRSGNKYEKSAELTPSDAINGRSKFGVSLSGGKGTNVLIGDIGNERSYLFSFEDGVWREKLKFDGVNTAISNNSIVDHTPKSFQVSGASYGGEVNFYDLVCDQSRRN